MTNPKIEKVKGEIAKTKAKIAEYQAKLREQERRKTQFENDEVVAMFRRENLSETEFAALLHATQGRGEAESAEIGLTETAAKTAADGDAARQHNKNEKEENADATDNE